MEREATTASCHCAGGRDRHPDGAILAGACGRLHHHDLSPRDEAPRSVCSKSAGSPMSPSRQSARSAMKIPLPAPLPTFTIWMRHFAVLCRTLPITCYWQRAAQLYCCAKYHGIKAYRSRIAKAITAGCSVGIKLQKNPFYVRVMRCSQ